LEARIHDLMEWTPNGDCELETKEEKMIWLYLAGGVLLVLLLIAGEIFKVTP